MEIGRPPVLDEGKKREICAILAVGCTRTVAARYVGCHPQTIRNTARRDESFALALEQAETKHEILHLSYINKAATEGRYWRAAAWALERRYPDRYGRRRPHVVTADQISAVIEQLAELVFQEVTDEQQRERISDRLLALTAELQVSAAKEDDA